MQLKTILSIVIFALALSAIAQEKSKDKSMQRLEIKYNQSREYVLGNTIDLDLIAYYGNDKTGSTKRKSAKKSGEHDKKLNWNKFEVTVEGGTFYKGRVTIFSKYKELKPETQAVEITVTSKKNKNISDRIIVTLSFGKQYTAYFNGADGADGKNGGLNAIGIFTRNGITGGDGENGENGASGDNVDVYVSTYLNMTLYSPFDGRVMYTRFLLKVLVTNKSGSHVEKFILNPEKGGKLDVRTYGGRGGKGGDGGRGNNGKNGRDATETKKCKNGGSGGDGGDGGNGGNGGNGGTIEVHISEELKDYVSIFNFQYWAGGGNKGGSAGSGGSGAKGGKGCYDGSDGSAGRPGGEGGPGQSAAEPAIVLYGEFKDVW